MATGNDSTVCGCCEGVEPLTPQVPENRPGLSSVSHRIGTHGAFKTTMLASLSSKPALGQFTSRAGDDPAVALIDSAAVVLHVLSFYQDRIANESFLRTAKERLSVGHLVNSIGYRLNPGVAASTYLAFTMDETEGAPESAILKEGIKVQSQPKQDEKAQTFETIEEIEARPEWNAMTLETSRWEEPSIGDIALHLEGIDTNLKPGDAILIVGKNRDESGENENWDFRRVAAIETDASLNITTVTLDRGIGKKAGGTEPAKNNVRVYAFRMQANIFGYNELIFEPPEDRDDPGPFPKLKTDHDSLASPIKLDAVYTNFATGGWVILLNASNVEAYSIDAAKETQATAGTVAAKVTQLALTGEGLRHFKVNDTVVFGHSELLPRAPRPVTSVVTGDSVILGKRYDNLSKGRIVSISGKTTLGEEAGEIRVLEAINPILRQDEAGQQVELTQLQFTESLSNAYVRASVRVNANVAAATHGETTFEILGNGNGALPFQRFTLKQTPLTYVPATTPTGGQSTLKVRVDDILWELRDSLFTADTNDEAYHVHLNDDQQSQVRFGDGNKGFRPPTGSNNITASYRVGLGLDGNVDSGQISTLLTRPLGLKEAVNPVAATGGDDPETRDHARANAPRSVLALDRVVSLQDFEDFASNYAGVGKAQASWIWDGQSRIVHLTLAGINGEEVDEPFIAGFRKSLDTLRDPFVRVEVDGFVRISFAIKARVLVNERFEIDAIYENVRVTLQEAFSFANRQFAQAVTASQVITVIQSVDGVIAVDLDDLQASAIPDPPPSLQPLLARAARHVKATDTKPSENLPAELLLIDPEIPSSIVLHPLSLS